MPVPVPAHETRPLALLREQYEVEKELAQRLLGAPAERRRGLYSEVYDELQRRVPHQPMAAQGADPAARAQLVELQSRLLARYLTPATDVLEVGSGDGSLARHLAQRVRSVTAVEASAALLPSPRPAGVRLVIADAPPYDLGDRSVDLAFSSHVVEHLHPEDAVAHAAEMRRVLRPGGVYVCVTPNRLYGPHDVSRYFCDRAEGLHLREYTFTELARLLRGAGFSKVQALRGIGVAARPAGLLPHRVIEAVFGRVPARARRRWMARLARHPLPEPLRPLEQVKVAATVAG